MPAELVRRDCAKFWDVVCSVVVDLKLISCVVVMRGLVRDDNRLAEVGRGAMLVSWGCLSRVEIRIAAYGVVKG